jgi:hypothetical protein
LGGPQCPDDSGPRGCRAWHRGRYSEQVDWGRASMPDRSIPPYRCTNRLSRRRDPLQRSLCGSGGGSGSEPSSSSSSLQEFAGGTRRPNENSASTSPSAPIPTAGRFLIGPTGTMLSSNRYWERKELHRRVEFYYPQRPAERFNHRPNQTTEGASSARTVEPGRKKVEVQSRVVCAWSRSR